VSSLPPDAFPAAAPLRELAAFERARRGLERSRPPDDPRGFEDLLPGHLGDLVYHLSILEGLSAERGVDLGTERAKSLATEELERWEGSFSEILRRVDAANVLRIETLGPGWVHGMVASFKPAEVLWILVDGMRWDVWRYLREHFLPEVPGDYRIVGECLTWARLPTDTATQLEHLRSPLGSTALVETEKVVSREDYLRRRSAAGAGATTGLVVKLDFIDHKVHTFRETLYEFYREARIGAEIHLRGLLEALPARSIAVVFADHGFREDPAFQPSRRYESTRYTHGGDHFLEVLAPAAAMYKAARG
jgi:hypothetical protein